MQLNMVFRHGTRYPSIKDMRNFNKVASKINKAADTLDSSVNLTLPLTIPYREELDKLLADVGENELYEIGKRMRARFPEALQEQYCPSKYRFPSSCKLRATHSAMALAMGLFEGHGTTGPLKSQPVAIDTLPCDKDRVLRFFDHCEEYVTNVLDNRARFREIKEFLEEKEILLVIDNVKRKLGRDDIELTGKDLTILFKGCAYDIALFGGSRSSGLCSLFDEHDMRIMEYALDLQNFYKRSAGYKINFESSCPLLADFFHSLQAKAGRNSKYGNYSGVFRASHAETLIPLYALLGVRVDEETLVSENYEQMKNRQFRPGCLAPFAGNIMFVLYECDKGRDYKIQLYVNERLTRIPCCKSDVDCDFKTFEKCYQEVVDGCDFEHICRLKQRTEL